MCVCVCVCVCFVSYATQYTQYFMAHYIAVSRFLELGFLSALQHTNTGNCETVSARRRWVGERAGGEGERGGSINSTLLLRQAAVLVQYMIQTQNSNVAVVKLNRHIIEQAAFYLSLQNLFCLGFFFFMSPFLYLEELFMMDRK